MKDDDIAFFEDYERQRDAEMIKPPNRLKEKVGSGGIDPLLIERAEQFLQSNSVEFAPIAEMYFGVLEDSIQRILKEDIIGEDAFDALLYPLVQLKAHGGMFQYPLVTEISSMLINFLEVIRSMDKDAVDVILAHKMTLRAVLTSRIQNGSSPQGRALIKALKEACMRYFHARGKSK